MDHSGGRKDQRLDVTFRALRNVFPFAMSNKITFVFTLITILAVVVLAADVGGKWVAQVPGREGQTRETVFNFKVEGDKLTGTMSGRQGQEIAISDGKVSGDTLSFVVTMERGGNSIRWTYTGKIAGDEIQMKREGGRGSAREFTAKRAN